MARYDDTFVDRFLEPWNRHDVDGALALMTDDCVWEVTRGREPHGTLYTGQTAVRSAIVEAFKALPDVNYQPVRNSFGEDHDSSYSPGSCGHRYGRSFSVAHAAVCTAVQGAGSHADPPSTRGSSRCARTSPASGHRRTR